MIKMTLNPDDQETCRPNTLKNDHLNKFKKEKEISLPS